VLSEKPAKPKMIENTKHKTAYKTVHKGLGQLGSRGCSQPHHGIKREVFEARVRKRSRKAPKRT